LGHGDFQRTVLLAANPIDASAGLGANGQDDAVGNGF
jgi:hypothetical protein